MIWCFWSSYCIANVVTNEEQHMHHHLHQGWNYSLEDINHFTNESWCIGEFQRHPSPKLKEKIGGMPHRDLWVSLEDINHFTLES